LGDKRLNLRCRGYHREKALKLKKSRTTSVKTEKLGGPDKKEKDKKKKKQCLIQSRRPQKKEEGE